MKSFVLQQTKDACKKTSWGIWKRYAFETKIPLLIEIFFCFAANDYCSNFFFQGRSSNCKVILVNKALNVTISHKYGITKVAPCRGDRYRSSMSNERPCFNKGSSGAAYSKQIRISPMMTTNEMGSQQHLFGWLESDHLLAVNYRKMQMWISFSKVIVQFFCYCS